MAILASQVKRCVTCLVLGKNVGSCFNKHFGRLTESMPTSFMKSSVPILVLSVQSTALLNQSCYYIGVPYNSSPVQCCLVTIILNIEVTTCLQQNLDNVEMTLVGSKMQGGPAMLGNCYLGTPVDKLHHILHLAFIGGYKQAF